LSHGSQLSLTRSSRGEQFLSAEYEAAIAYWEAQRFNGQRDVGKTELRFEPEDFMLEFRVDGKFIVEM
jgi:hypothetical protein